MKFLGRLRAGRGVQRLKQFSVLSSSERQRTEDELVAMGSAGIAPVLECLSHGEARGPALEILDRLLSDDTLEVFLDALASSNPAVVSGVTQLLSSSRRYDPNSLLAKLLSGAVPRAKLEAILVGQTDALSPTRILMVLPDIQAEERAVVFRLLEKTADASLVPGLVRFIRHEDWRVRVQMTRILADFPDPMAIKGIAGRLGDEHKGVRLEAALALHKMRATQAVPDLVEALRDSDLKVQSAVIDALTDIGDVTAVPHLISVLTDESEYARRAAVEVLNVVATTEAIQDLVRALRDQDWWVRVRAADALGSLGGDKVVRAVIGLMSDDDDFIRRQAVEILNSLPDRQAVETLIAALDDSDWWVRERAIDALAKTGDPRAVEPLIAVMKNEEKCTALCARALGVLGEQGAVEALTVLCDGDDDEVKQAAGEALKAIARGKRSSGAGGGGSDRLVDDGIPFETAPGSGRAALSPDELPDLGPLPAARPESSGFASLASGSLRDEKREREPTPTAHRKSEANLDFTDLPDGTVLLDRYRIIRKIGKGGYGAIYLAEDSAIKDELILKILNPQLSFDESALLRFVQELKLTRRVTHRNVIRIYDFLNLGGAHAVSMEYFAGRNLAEELYESGPLPFKRALHILSQACDGLAAAHAEGVIHRDIKPGNILVGAEDEVKIVDFGLASAQHGSGSRLTKSGLLIGTPEYMAPELISGDKVDHRVDIYSLGIVLYEILTGERPFTADTPVRVLFQHLEAEAKPLASLVEGVPEGLQELVSAAMARAPDDRPLSVNAFKENIEKELETLGVSG